MESASKWLLEVVHTSSKTITSLGVIFAFLFFAGGWMWDALLRDSMVESVQELNGTPQIVSAIETVTVEQRALRSDVTDLSAQVKAITPDPQIVEYDELRTRAPDPCFREQSCSVNIRSRRTSFGETCGAPTVTGRSFVDSLGVTFTPARINPTVPARQDGRWSTTTVDFVVPAGAAYGDGEYQLSLTYEGCRLISPTGELVSFGPIVVDSYPALVEIQPKDAP